MIDVRNPDAMVNRLGEAQRRFERGAPVPHVARELLDELVEALAESGPLELGLTSRAWLTGISSAERGLAAACGDASRRSVRRAKRSIGELKQVFGATTRAEVVFLAIAWALVILMLPLLLPLLLVLVPIGSFKERYVPNARKVAKGLELPERLLFAHSVRASRSEVSSAARARFGAYVHPVLVATERRLLLAWPPSELPAEARERAFAVVWEIRYPCIRSVSSRTVGNGDYPREVVTVQTGEREIAYEMPSDDGKALVAIVKQRAPEAITDSVASSEEVAAAAT